MEHHQDMPYRTSVGVMLINAQGLVFIGRRTNLIEDANTHAWQMPQGGVDADELPWHAAQRELYEETNIDSVERIAESGEWLTYDIPHTIAGRAWKGRYRGQRQKWFAVKFTGQDSEIDVEKPGGGLHKAEFTTWRWEPAHNLVDLVVPFKRPVYEQVVREFAHLVAH